MIGAVVAGRVSWESVFLGMCGMWVRLGALFAAVCITDRQTGSTDAF